MSLVDGGCPSILCRAQYGDLPIASAVIGRFFVAPSADTARLIVPDGSHIHDCVIVVLEPPPSGFVAHLRYRRRRIRMYWRIIRMTVRMLRHGMTAVDAYGP